MNKFHARKLIFRLIVILSLLIAAYFVIPVSMPLILAGISAFFLEPIVMFFKRKWKMSRKIAVAFIYIVSVFVISIICYLSITQIMTQIILLSKQAPYYISKLSDMWLHMQENISKYTEDFPPEVSASLQKTTMDFIKKVEESFLSFFNYSKVSAFFSEIPSLFISLLVYMIALFLFMLDLPKLKQITYKYLKPNTAKKIKIILKSPKRCYIWLYEGSLICKLYYWRRHTHWTAVNPTEIRSNNDDYYLVNRYCTIPRLYHYSSALGTLPPVNGKHLYSCKIIHLSCYFTYYSSSSRA